MKLLADDAYGGDDDDDGDNDGVDDCENDLGPFHHPDRLPIVTQWAGLEVADTTSRTVHEAPAITEESGLSRRRPHCRRPGTLSRLGHSTLPPLWSKFEFALCACGKFLIIQIRGWYQTQPLFLRNYWFSNISPP
jgi:hypothetical protein